MRLVFKFAVRAAWIALAFPAFGAPVSAEFAPDRFHFSPLDFSQVGREIPFVYDVPGAVRDAKRDPRTGYQTWVGLGLQALREQRFDEAADCFSSAALRTNEPPDILRHLYARALLSGGRAQDAEDAWEEICKKNPSDAEARWQLGYSFFLRDETDAALVEFGRLRELAPAHPFPPLLLGLVNWTRKERAAAERSIIESTRRNRAPAQSFLAMAALAAESGGWPESLGWLRRAFDRLSPEEQKRWFAKPQFTSLRNSGSPLLEEFEREFHLRAEAQPVEADGPRRPRDGYDFATDHAFNTSLEFSPLREAEGTNAPPVPEGLQVLRLAPRLVPK